MRVVVSGATGFVGANLCRRFLAQGHDVVALIGKERSDWRLRLDHPRLSRANVNFEVEGDLRGLIARVRPEVWLNCAAYGAYPSQTESNRIYRVNFDAVRWILEALRETQDLRAFVQMGSQSEYGLNCSAPAETLPPLPDSDYAVSKVAATALTQFYGKKHGLPAWVFRLYSVYGPYEDTSRLVPKLLAHAQNKKLPPLVNPKVSRDFIHVDDVCDATAALIQKALGAQGAGHFPRGEVFNIGTGACTTLEQLVTTARSAFGIQEAPSWGSMPDRDWDHADWYSNPSKAREVLGWSATTPLREGLQKTLAWMEAEPALFREGTEHSVIS
jgi:polyisoprenyl-phosphate glycosyltransferase